MAKSSTNEKKITEGEKGMSKASSKEKEKEKNEAAKESSQDIVENLKTDVERDSNGGAKAAAEQLDITKLKDMKMAELNKITREMNIVGASGLKKQDLIFKILQGQAESAGLMFGE